jgi:hypothetical protein
VSHFRAYEPFTLAPTNVKICSGPPPFARAVHSRGAKRAGLLYQGKVSRLLEQLYGFQYISDPWFRYSLGGQEKLCSPDGVFFDLKRGRVVVVEVKLSHTPLAFAQLRNKYLPILQAALGVMARGIVPQSPSGAASVAGHFAAPDWTFHLVEIAPSYDPLLNGGENVRIVRNLNDLLPQECGVNVFPLQRASSTFNSRVN